MIRNRIPLDRAIVFAVAARLWQFLAGGVSMLIIAKHLSLDAQGFFYAFAGLLTMLTFFDLGLTGVLMYVASHEWSAAAGVEGEANARARRRLGELIARSRQWFGASAIAFAGIAGAAGHRFFITSDVAGVAWEWPWFATVGFSSISLWLAPSIAILEGCNRMATVNAVRFAQAVAGNAVVWTIMLNGGELWAVPASAAVRCAFEAALVGHRCRPFLRNLVASSHGGAPELSWKRELLPLQWRIAVQSLAGYFALGLPTLLIFKAENAAEGGRMGMTWNAISTIQIAAFAWVHTRIPQIGRLISERRVSESKALFRHLLAVSCGVYALGCGALWLLVELTGRYFPRLADRLLPSHEVALLCVGMGCTHIAVGLGTYVRAHKIDPFLRIGVSTAFLLGCLIVYLGARFGPIGIASAHIGVIGCISLPIHIAIYRRTGTEPRSPA